MRPRNDPTSHRIEAATLELFRRRGPRRTSITDLCRAAGVSRMTFYARFPSKEALELVFVRAHQRRTRGLLAELASSSESLPAKLQRVLRLKDEMFDQFGERWLLELSSAQGEVGRAIEEGRAEVAVAIDRFFEAERRRGGVRQGLTTKQLHWLWRNAERMLTDPSLAELVPRARARERFVVEQFFGAIARR